MNLYESFADHYDAVFPAEKLTAVFLIGAFSESPILDLGCATGGYALALASKGFVVEGIDLDARMIAIAGAKKAVGSGNVLFRVGDIRDLAAKNAYGGIYCIGNTLVHLADEETISEMIQKMFAALKPGGTTVVQIVNYDRILAAKVTSLPTIRNDGREFFRRYRLEGGRIVFATVLTCRNEHYEAETTLVPLTSAGLVAAFTGAGFRSIETFGGFDLRPYDLMHSFSLILKAVKP